MKNKRKSKESKELTVPKSLSNRKEKKRKENEKEMSSHESWGQIPVPNLIAISIHRWLLSFLTFGAIAASVPFLFTTFFFLKI